MAYLFELFKFSVFLYFELILRFNVEMLGLVEAGLNFGLLLSSFYERLLLRRDIKALHFVYYGKVFRCMVCVQLEHGKSLQEQDDCANFLGLFLTWKKIFNKHWSCLCSSYWTFWRTSGTKKLVLKSRYLPFNTAKLIWTFNVATKVKREPIRNFVILLFLNYWEVGGANYKIWSDDVLV